MDILKTVLFFTLLFYVLSCAEDNRQRSPIDYSRFKWVEKYKLNNLTHESEEYNYPYIVFRDDTVDLYRTHFDSVGPDMALGIIHIGPGIRDYLSKTITKTEGITFTTGGIEEGRKERLIHLSVYDKKVDDFYKALYAPLVE